MKTCKQCRRELSLEEFFRDKQFRDGRAALCKSCKMARTAQWRSRNREYYNSTMKQWRKAHPEAIEKHRIACLLKRYGISKSDHEAMLKRQGERCAICGLEKPKRWNIDHDHATGRVRGLLCHHCNVLLGMAKDSVTTLQAAIRYLGGN